VAAALDDWAMVLRDCGFHDPERDPAVWKRLLEIARLADPDPWRGELRRLIGREDLSALRKLAETSDVQSLQLMGSALVIGGDGPACVAWLRKAHRQHPGDVLISFDLAFHLGNLPSADRVDVLRFAEAALAARPQSAPMYTMVDHSPDGLGRSDEAIANYRRALELKPDNAIAHSQIGHALCR
jgi:serine/threonine-protein kinase